VTKERLKQVGVRLSPDQHKKALEAAKREGISFGEFVRQAVWDKIDAGKAK